MNLVLDSGQRKTGFILAAIVFLTSGFFFQSGVDNEAARFAQARAIAEEGTVSIDRFAYRSADIIQYDGHWYPGKAPGLSFLAAPLWGAIASTLTYSSLPQSFRDHLTCYLITWILCGGALALITSLFYFTTLALGVSPNSALLGSVGLGFGTIFLPFGTVLFGHVPSALLLFLAFSLPILRANSSSTFLLAGAAAGLGFSCEYPLAIGGVALGVWILNRFGVRAGAIFGGAAIFGALPALLYHAAVFGDPFFFPYSVYAQEAQSVYSQHQRGLLGIAFPSINILRKLLLGTERGLFVFNPWLILFVLTPFIRACRTREGILCWGVASLYLVMNAGYGEMIIYWGGGASLGPRHLLPAIPFISLLITIAMDNSLRLKALGEVTILISAIVMLIGTAVEPRTPYDYLNPLRQFYLPWYLNGEFSSQNYGVFSSIPMTSDSVSWNIGELIGLPGDLQLLPLLLPLAALWLLRLPLRFRSFELGLLSVVLLAPIFARTTPPIPAGIVRTVFHNQLFTAPDKNLATVATTTSLDSALVFPEGFPEIASPFSIEWSGELTIPTSGEWSFALESDDGSAMFLGDELLINNWGEHGMRSVLATRTLSAGRYPFTVRYFEKNGGGGITLLWRGAREHLRPVPSRSFSHQPVRVSE